MKGLGAVVAQVVELPVNSTAPFVHWQMGYYLKESKRGQGRLSAFNSGNRRWKTQADGKPGRMIRHCHEFTPKLLG